MSGGVVVTDQDFGSVEREREVAVRLGVPFAQYSCVSEDETVAAVEGARVVFVNFAPVTRRVLEVLGEGAVVIRYGIGYDNVDVTAAAELGVAVCNVPDYGADTVADHTVALLLTLLRRVGDLNRAVHERGWAKPAELGSIRGFSETTVGLIGTGRIGRAVAARLLPFGFTVVAYDPFVDAAALAEVGIRSASLEEVFEQSHAVSLHAPLTEQNRRLVDAAALARMPEGAVLVNTSRGGLVDQDALYEAVRSGRLRGAALDVFDPEPLTPDSPLRDLDSVLLTPHAAFFSDVSLANLQRLAAEEAERALTGRPLRCRVA